MKSTMNPSKKSVLVTARAHDCEDILQPTFRPKGDADSLELFRLKNDFMSNGFIGEGQNRHSVAGH